MTKKQALREAAEKANPEQYGFYLVDAFTALATPDTVLALLDELEAAEMRIAELPRQKHLIGWRMADYTDETADPALAKNWATAVDVLPIFEGDVNTKLGAAMLHGAAGNSPAIPDDVRRMDWLVSKTVDVREPMVYGSQSLFWSQTITDEEDDYHATKLREQIDAAMAAENSAAPQQEVM